MKVLPYPDSPAPLLPCSPTFILFFLGFVFWPAILLPTSYRYTQVRGVWLSQRKAEENAPLPSAGMSHQRALVIALRRADRGGRAPTSSNPCLSFPSVSAASLLSGAWAVVTQWLGEELKAMAFLSGF